MAPSAGTRRPTPSLPQKPRKRRPGPDRPRPRARRPLGGPRGLRHPAFGLRCRSWSSVLEIACPRGTAEEGPCKGVFG